MENNKTWARICAGIAALVGLGIYLVITPKPFNYSQPALIKNISYVIIFTFLAISAFANKPKLNIVTSITMILSSVMQIYYDMVSRYIYLRWDQVIKYFGNHIRRLSYIFTQFKSWCGSGETRFWIAISFIIIGLFILIAILSNSKTPALYSVLPMVFLILDSIITIGAYPVGYQSNINNVGKTIVVSSSFSSIADKLEGLKQLVDKNILTEEEFNQKKEELLKDYNY